MIRVLGSCSGDFRSFLEKEGRGLLERLGLDGDVVVLVYESAEELPEPFDDYFAMGQTTLIEPGGGRILVVEENWRLRDRESWPSLLAQALVEALVPPPSVPSWAAGWEEPYLAYKVLRNYQVHSLLAERRVLEAVADAKKVIGWILKEVSPFTPQLLSRGSCSLMLVIATALAAAWPYREFDPDLASRIERLLKSLPPRWRELLVKGLERGVGGLEKALKDLCERLRS